VERKKGEANTVKGGEKKVSKINRMRKITAI
jgi:hypothetical protein